MEVNGTALTEYAFTATRIRQEMGDTSIDFGKIPASNTANINVRIDQNGRIRIGETSKMPKLI